VDDAKMAVEKGFDGIVVSNHAGRQVDGACASLDALEKIVDGKCGNLPSKRTEEDTDKSDSCGR
jgi:isopentenyl diphosphate isomerase/L-lactate dehydrogenase-like FMN-dependent dehydrogenase